MNVNDLEKERSQFAYRSVVKADSNEKIKKDYKSYVKKIPMMILNNGLGATFAFVYSKKKDGNAYNLIYNQVDKWLQESYIQKPKGDLVKWIIEQESPVYRATTNEVLAFFNWLKRLADGMIEGEENGN